MIAIATSFLRCQSRSRGGIVAWCRLALDAIGICVVSLGCCSYKMTPALPPFDQIRLRNKPVGLGECRFSCDAAELWLRDLGEEGASAMLLSTLGDVWYMGVQRDVLLVDVRAELCSSEANRAEADFLQILSLCSVFLIPSRVETEVTYRVTLTFRDRTGNTIFCEAIPEFRSRATEWFSTLVPTGILAAVFSSQYHAGLLPEESHPKVVAWRIVDRLNEDAMQLACAERLAKTRCAVGHGEAATAPHITFVEPKDNATTSDDRIRLVATVVDLDGSLSEVRVEAGNQEGSMRGIEGVTEQRAVRREGDERILQHTVPLALGTNRIRITATDNDGQSASRVLNVTRERKVGKTYVVAVGINKYPRPWSLHCARQDAERFCQFAKSDLGAEARDVYPLLDGNSTRRRIMSVFGDLRRRIKPEDTLVVFLAGHGRIERPGGREERYFVPVDADWRNLFGTAIAMEEFRRMLDVPAERVLVIADTRYSGDIALRGGTGDLFRPLVGKGRILVGYSGTVRENGSLGAGYLTHYLLEGLRGPADQNRDERITLREAYEYASERVRHATTTGLWIKGEGDLILIRSPQH